MVISGKHKGKVAKVEEVIIKHEGSREQRLVKLAGVNEAKKAVKGQWFVTKTLPIHISNVMYYSEKDGKPSRVGIVIDKDGAKKRKLKKFDVTMQ